MSAHDPDIIKAHNDGFTQGESFGRHAARQELLPLLREVVAAEEFDALLIARLRLKAAIADIETT